MSLGPPTQCRAVFVTVGGRDKKEAGEGFFHGGAPLPPYGAFSLLLFLFKGKPAKFHPSTRLCFGVDSFADGSQLSKVQTIQMRSCANSELGPMATTE